MVVVALGIFSLARVSYVSQLSFVRVIRTFRVVRLFKRLESLNKIINSIIKSIPGVASAFLVMLIVMSIYAVITVDLFRDFGNNGQYETTQVYGRADAQYGDACGEDAMACRSGAISTFTNITAVTAVTARGVYYGQEYYGTFSRALFTLFQVLTGESWSEAVVRPLIIGADNPGDAILVAIVYVSYIIVTSIILQNVVVAVLIDKFTDNKPLDEEAQLVQDLEDLKKMVTGEKGPTRAQQKASAKMETDERTNEMVHATFSEIGCSSPANLLMQATAAPEARAAAGATSTSQVSFNVAGSSSTQLSGGSMLNPQLQQHSFGDTHSRAGVDMSDTEQVMLKSILQEQLVLRTEQRAMQQQMGELTALLRQLVSTNRDASLRA